MTLLTMACISLVFVGCSSSNGAGSGSAASSAAPSTIATSEAPTTPPEPSTTATTIPTGPMVSVDLTDMDGWHYAFQSKVAPVPQFTKDITSSPPGYAKIVTSYTATDPPIAMTVSDDNPGRPNGPALTVNAAGVTWDSSTATAAGGSDGCVNGGDGGMGSGPGYQTISGSQVIVGLICSYPVTSFDLQTQADVPEAAVDAFIAAIPKLPNGYLFHLSNTNGLTCSIIVSPTEVLEDTIMGIGGPYCSSLKTLSATLSGE